MSQDPWRDLQSFTDARIAIGRSGGSLLTKELLRFRMDHALAKDAVWSELNEFDLINGLSFTGLPIIKLSSMAANRERFVQRPDLGRELSEQSKNELINRNNGSVDLCIIIADGLSALAIERNAVPFLKVFLAKVSKYQMGPICIVRQGRVALGDEIGERLGAKLTVMLIGERPGLSSPDSLGIYMTYDPKKGNTDERRNCLSNIRREGLDYELAASKLAYLIDEAMVKKISGVELKDNFDKQIE
jgi:ethanolamine ammonia-lyase small subunit